MSFVLKINLLELKNTESPRRRVEISSCRLQGWFISIAYKLVFFSTRENNALAPAQHDPTQTMNNADILSPLQTIPDEFYDLDHQPWTGISGFSGQYSPDPRTLKEKWESAGMFGIYTHLYAHYIEFFPFL